MILLEPDVIVHVAANQGYNLSPLLVNLLSGYCEYKTTILLYELMIMFPDELVFNIGHLSEVLGIVIIDGCQHE